MTQVAFPEPQDLKVNMMPIIMGDVDSIPEELRGYVPLINACNFEEGTTVYLTVHESSVDPGTSQRRGGIHTEAFKPSPELVASWGGGFPWPGRWGGDESPSQTPPVTPEPKEPGAWGGGATFPSGSWGGGSWGGSAKGLYMASTDGACRIWETQTSNVDGHGGVLEDLTDVPSFKCEPSTLYWMTDRTPHEALPSDTNYRQFFRLVSEDVSFWFTEHNTPNPLGVEPKCPKIDVNKFAPDA